MNLQNLNKKLEKSITSSLHDNTQNRKENDHFIKCLALKLKSQSRKELLEKNDRNVIAERKIKIAKLSHEIKDLEKAISEVKSEFEKVDKDERLQEVLRRYKLEHELYKIMLDMDEFGKVDVVGK